MERRKKQKLKNGIFDGPIIVNQTFSQIEFIISKSDFAHNLPSLKILVIKRWFPLNFAKILQGRNFVVGKSKNHKLLADILFDSDF